MNYKIGDKIFITGFKPEFYTLKSEYVKSEIIQFDYGEVEIVGYNKTTKNWMIKFPNGKITSSVWFKTAKEPIAKDLKYLLKNVVGVDGEGNVCEGICVGVTPSEYKVEVKPNDFRYFKKVNFKK